MGKSIFIKVLVILGMLLVWLSILSPIIASIAAFFVAHKFLFDYLMPAEMFPEALLGGGLLVWAAFLSRSRKKLIILSFIVALGSLVLGQMLAVVTGLSSGKTDPSFGWPWIFVVSSLVVYSLALIGIGVGGLILSKNIFFRPLTKKNK